MTPAVRPKPWYYTALQLAMAGAEPADIAAKLARPKASVTRMLASEWAQTEMARFHEAVMVAAARVRLDPIVELQRLVPGAIEKLKAKLDCGDDKVEFLAACRILDNAGHTVIKRIQVTEDEILNQCTREEKLEIARTGRIPARFLGQQMLPSATAIAIADAVSDDG